MAEDFETMWEARFLAVAEPFLDPKPDLVEGSGVVRLAGDSTLAVIVSPGERVANGYLNCEVVAEFKYSETDKAEDVSRSWGQILEAFGNGKDGDSPLRLRLAEGRLVIPGGINSILPDWRITNDPSAGIKQYIFSAILGILPPN